MTHLQAARRERRRSRRESRVVRAHRLSVVRGPLRRGGHGSDPAFAVARRVRRASPGARRATWSSRTRNAAHEPEGRAARGARASRDRRGATSSRTRTSASDRRTCGRSSPSWRTSAWAWSTSLFAGTGERTLGAALENLQLCAATAPGLAAMNAVSRRPFTVGKSMAVRRRDLARLGGFQPVGHVLAEDHVLGRRFLEAGLKARTSFEVVENRNVACTVARTLERHTRWAKLRRSLNPAGFLAEPVLTPVVVASGRRGRGALQADRRGPRGRVRGADGLCALRGSATSRSSPGMVVRPARDRAVLRDAALLGVRVREPADRLARAPLLPSPREASSSRTWRSDRPAERGQPA